MKLVVLALATQGLDARSTNNPRTAHASLNKMAHHAGRIVPPLEDVDTDKKFFGPPFPADYPHDGQPGAKKEVFQKGQPYPKVQEQGFFDKDYVKDENSDGGEWKAQMDYDVARTRIDRAKTQKQVAEKQGEAEAHDVAEAERKYNEQKDKEDKAVNNARDAEKKVEEEAKNEESAKKTVKDKEQRAKDKAAAAKEAEKDAKTAMQKHEEAKKALEKRVQEAKDALEEERESFKECQKELDEAKAKVEGLKKQRDALSKTKTDEGNLLLKEKHLLEDQERILREEEVKTKVAEAKRDAALAKLTFAKSETAVSQKELDKQKAEHDAAEAKVQQETADVKAAEKEMAEARNALRKSRGQSALPAGEAVPTPPSPQTKSGTVGKAVSGFLAAVLLLVAFAS